MKSTLPPLSKEAISRWRRAPNLLKLMKRFNMPEHTGRAKAISDVRSKLGDQKLWEERRKQFHQAGKAHGVGPSDTTSLLDLFRRLGHSSRPIAADGKRRTLAGLSTTMRSANADQQYSPTDPINSLASDARMLAHAGRPRLNTIPNSLVDNLPFMGGRVYPHQGQTLFRGETRVDPRREFQRRPFMHGAAIPDNAQEYGAKFSLQGPHPGTVSVVDEYAASPRQRHYPDWVLDNFLPKAPDYMDSQNRAYVAGQRMSPLQRMRTIRDSSEGFRRGRDSRQTVQHLQDEDYALSNIYDRTPMNEIQRMYETPIRPRNQYLGRTLRRWGGGVHPVTPGTPVDKYLNNAMTPVIEYVQQGREIPAPIF